eukprot:gene9527-6687_t
MDSMFSSFVSLCGCEIFFSFFFLFFIYFPFVGRLVFRTFVSRGIISYINVDNSTMALRTEACDRVPVAVEIDAHTDDDEEEEEEGEEDGPTVPLEGKGPRQSTISPTGPPRTTCEWKKKRLKAALGGTFSKRLPVHVETNGRRATRQQLENPIPWSLGGDAETTESSPADDFRDIESALSQVIALQRLRGARLAGGNGKAMALPNPLLLLLLPATQQQYWTHGSRTSSLSKARHPDPSGAALPSRNSNTTAVGSVRERDAATPCSRGQQRKEKKNNSSVSPPRVAAALAGPSAAQRRTRCGGPPGDGGAVKPNHRRHRNDSRPAAPWTAVPVSGGAAGGENPDPCGVKGRVGLEGGDGRGAAPHLLKSSASRNSSTSQEGRKGKPPSASTGCGAAGRSLFDKAPPPPRLPETGEDADASVVVMCKGRKVVATRDAVHPPGPGTGPVSRSPLVSQAEDVVKGDAYDLLPETVVQLHEPLVGVGHSAAAQHSRLAQQPTPPPHHPPTLVITQRQGQKPSSFSRSYHADPIVEELERDGADGGAHFLFAVEVGGGCSGGRDGSRRGPRSTSSSTGAGSMVNIPQEQMFSDVFQAHHDFYMAANRSPKVVEPPPPPPATGVEEAPPAAEMDGCWWHGGMRDPQRAASDAKPLAPSLDKEGEEPRGVAGVQASAAAASSSFMQATTSARRCRAEQERRIERTNTKRDPLQRKVWLVGPAAVDCLVAADRSLPDHQGQAAGKGMDGVLLDAMLLHEGWLHDDGEEEEEEEEEEVHTMRTPDRGVGDHWGATALGANHSRSIAGGALTSQKHVPLLGVNDLLVSNSACFAPAEEYLTPIKERDTMSNAPGGSRSSVDLQRGVIGFKVTAKRDRAEERGRRGIS